MRNLTVKRLLGDVYGIHNSQTGQFLRECGSQEEMNTLLTRLGAGNGDNPGAKIVLTPEKAEKFFYSALCNGADYFAGYGFQINYSTLAYKKAKATFLEKNPDSSICREDVWMEILRIEGPDNYLVFDDIEGEGENTRRIYLKDVHNKVALTPIRHLMAMINEEDDAETADCILQSVLFDGEIIFS